MAPSFSDIGTHWAKDCILELAQRRLVSGYPDGSFRPDTTLTRAEFAVLMNNAFPQAQPVRPPLNFPDVPLSHWAHNAVQWGYTRGLFSGYPDGRFQPNIALPRMQAVVVLVTALRLQPLPSPDETLRHYFDDQATIPDWTRWAVATAVASDRVIVNYPNVRQFLPLQDATRGDVAAMLCRALSLPGVPPSSATWHLGIYDLKGSVTVPFERWRGSGRLMRDIQTLLTPFRLFPPGDWVSGRYDSPTEAALREFCGFYGLPTMDVGVFNARFAETLLQADPVDLILAYARDRGAVYQDYLAQESGFDASKLAFLDRGIASSPWATAIADYPTRLQQVPDGQTVASPGRTAVLTGSQQTVTYSPFPQRGIIPALDTAALNFLTGSILQACVCIGSFVDGQIWVRWLGKNALQPAQLWSSTKILPLLNVVAKANAIAAEVPVRECLVCPSGSRNGYGFYNLAADLVNYSSSIASSNAIAALFKQFSTPGELDSWVKQLTGNSALEFRGRYGENPLLSRPDLVRQSSGQRILSSPATDHAGNNFVSTYDLVRILAMLGWHNHLPVAARIPNAQWSSLETVVRAMGTDTARYLDVAIERLGLTSRIESPVILSKLGFGRSSIRDRTELTYLAMLQFVDPRPRKQGKPGMLRTVCMALLGAEASGDANAEARQLDARMAAEVTEILRRVVTQEMA
ncbi:MAG: S-layer homology domain-containing protein [Synechococcales cyanobacterium M58_A2018_015]|nr:S-layer homology domain-containing protein [Synechococcales cyanobacterium M58_A2018_015]